MANNQVWLKTKEGTVFSTSHPEYHADCERLPQAKGKEARREYCIAELLKLLQPGDKVYCLVRSVSSSGMSRKMSLYIVRDNDIRSITSYVADILQWGIDDKGYLKVSGCGMDMGFHTVYTLGRYLFRDGFKVEGRGRNGDTSGHDSDGGYALKHEWI